MDYPGLLNRVLPTYYAVHGREYGAHWGCWSRTSGGRSSAYGCFNGRSSDGCCGMHSKRSLYYQRKYARIRFEDIRCMEDFRKLPPRSRAEVNENGKELRDPNGKEKLIPHAVRAA